MRRSKSEVKDIERIEEFLKEEKVCRIGLCDKEEIYIVPMNYGFKREGTSLTFYTHGAKIGKRHDMAKANPNVCVEIDGRHQLKEAERVVDYGFFYMSLIGRGKIRLIEDNDEKIEGLNAIMVQQSGKIVDKFPEGCLNAVCIYEIALDTYTVKEHRKPM